MCNRLSSSAPSVIRTRLACNESPPVGTMQDLCRSGIRVLRLLRKLGANAARMLPLSR